MGIKKDAFFRDMVRTAVSLGEVLPLWVELFKKFGDKPTEAFNHIADNRNRFGGLLIDYVPKEGYSTGKSMEDVFALINQYVSREQENIRMGVREDITEDEKGDMFVRAFKSMFPKVELDIESIPFLKNMYREVDKMSLKDFIDRINIHLNQKNFFERYKPMYEKYQRGMLSPPKGGPMTTQQMKDITSPESIKVAGISPIRVVMQYLNSLDQR